MAGDNSTTEAEIPNTEDVKDTTLNIPFTAHVKYRHEGKLLQPSAVSTSTQTKEPISSDDLVTRSPNIGKATRRN